MNKRFIAPPKKNLVIIVLLLVITLPLSAFGPFQVQHLPNQFTFYQQQGFDRIRARDFIMQGRPGTPELPVKYLHYIIPPNMKVNSIRILSRTITQIPGSCYIYPAQPIVPLCSIPSWVGPDSTIYNSDSLFPNKFVEIANTGVFDGARLVTVAVYPLQYRPRSRRIFLINNISFEFRFEPTSIPDRANVRGINGQKIYEAILKTVVENDADIPIYYQPPMLIPEEPPEQPPGGFFPSQYTIITADELVPYFFPYANWLTDKGVPASVVKLSNVLRYWNGVDDAEKLRNYIIDAYKNYGTIWILLGGDADIMPFRYGWADTFDRYDLIIPSDLYFSDLNGEWDYDDDNRWGEPLHDRVDIYPEVFVGRILCRNPEEVTHWVNKILYYEQFGSSDLRLFEQTAWIYDSEPYFAPNPVIFEIFPPYFNHYHYDGVGADIGVNALSYGFGFYHIYEHGDPISFISNAINGPPPEDWKIYAYWNRPPCQEVAGLNHLESTYKYYVVYSLSCENAAFDLCDTTIADGFIDTYENKGAVAFLGNTRLGLLNHVQPISGPSPELHYTFCKYLFNDEMYQLGTVEAWSKVNTYNPSLPYELLKRYWYVCHSHNLFGSPEMEPWIIYPNTMIIEHPATIPVGVSLKFVVRVTDENGNALCCTRVCLNKPGDIYDVSFTGRSGIVVFNICPETEGEIKVTCFRPRQSPNQYIQYLPSQTICRVEGKSSSGGQAQINSHLFPKELTLSVSSPILSSKNLIIFYSLPKQGRIKLMLYDITGKKIVLLKDSKQEAGYYSETFNLNKLSIRSGIYYLLIESGKDKKLRKLVLIN
ncbi:MAG: C25 family cysteine peptidase [candidate division WOR-3 bacterium]